MDALGTEFLGKAAGNIQNELSAQSQGVVKQKVETPELTKGEDTPQQPEKHKLSDKKIVSINSRQLARHQSVAVTGQKTLSYNIVALCGSWDEEKVKCLLDGKMGDNLYIRNEQGQTALQWAINEDSWPLVEGIIEKGVDLGVLSHSEEDNMLVQAAMKNSKQVLYHLLMKECCREYSRELLITRYQGYFNLTLLEWLYMCVRLPKTCSGEAKVFFSSVDNIDQFIFSYMSMDCFRRF